MSVDHADVNSSGRKAGDPTVVAPLADRSPAFRPGLLFGCALYFGACGPNGPDGTAVDCDLAAGGAPPGPPPGPPPCPARSGGNMLGRSSIHHLSLSLRKIMPYRSCPVTFSKFTSTSPSLTRSSVTG